MRASPSQPDPFARAVERVREGGLLAYPTETVYGLGGDARSQRAIARLLAWKGRSEAHPVPVLVTGLPAAEQLGIEVPDAAHRLAAAFWPGPLTLVLRCRTRFARGVAGEGGAVGLRCSSHPLAAALALQLERAGVGPITATSLNACGEPPARDVVEARRLCGTTLAEPALLEAPGPDAWGDAPSTVVDLSGPDPDVLREGPIRRTALDAVLERGAGA